MKGFAIAFILLTAAAAGHAADNLSLAQYKQQAVSLRWRDAAANLIPQGDPVIVSGTVSKVQDSRHIDVITAGHLGQSEYFSHPVHLVFHTVRTFKRGDKVAIFGRFRISSDPDDIPIVDVDYVTTPAVSKALGPKAAHIAGIACGWPSWPAQIAAVQNIHAALEAHPLVCQVDAADIQTGPCRGCAYLDEDAWLLPISRQKPHIYTFKPQGGRKVMAVNARVNLSYGAKIAKLFILASDVHDIHNAEHVAPGY
jgi:hypothetical protein